MISGLLSQLQNQYSLANAPNPAPAAGDPNGLSGLLQTTGIPMTANPMGMRTPNYMGLLGMMGQQPFTPGYTGIGGATGAPGQSDYLDRILGGMGGQVAPATGGGFGGYDRFGRPNFGSYLGTGGPFTDWVPFKEGSYAWQQEIDANQALQGG
jgi:hypothetical protein